MCPRWLTIALVGLLVVANTINIAADIGAMGEAVRLLVGGPRTLLCARRSGCSASRLQVLLLVRAHACAS